MTIKKWFDVGEINTQKDWEHYKNQQTKTDRKTTLSILFVYLAITTLTIYNQVDSELTSSIAILAMGLIMFMLVTPALKRHENAEVFLKTKKIRRQIQFNSRRFQEQLDNQTLKNAA